MATQEEVYNMFVKAFNDTVAPLVHKSGDIRFVIGEGNASDPNARAWYVLGIGEGPFGPLDQHWCKKFAAGLGINFDQRKAILNQFIYDSLIDKFANTQEQFIPASKSPTRATTEKPNTHP